MNLTSLQNLMQRSVFGRGTRVSAVIGALVGLSLLRSLVKGDERYGAARDGLEQFIIGLALLAAGVVACVTLWWILQLGYGLLRLAVRALTKVSDRLNESLTRKR